MKTYKGLDGDIELHDDHLVIRREGLVAKMSQRRSGARKIPLAAVSEVALEPPRMGVYGYLRLQLGGDSPETRVTDDPNAISFKRRSAAAFEELASLLKEQIAQNAAAGIDPSTIEVDRGNSPEDRHEKMRRARKEKDRGRKGKGRAAQEEGRAAKEERRAAKEERRARKEEMASAAEAAQERLKNAVAELERTRQAATDQVKAAREPLEQEIKRYTRRVSDAEESVDRAFEDREVARLRVATPSLVLRETTLRIGDRIRPITPDLKASVDSEGNLATKSRMTLTRIGLGGLVAGPLGAVVGAGAQKGVELDKRALYLLFEADAWAVVSQCDPNRGKAAREFAQQVNLAARQITTVRERQLHTARGAHEVLAAASADREAMSELAATFDETRADAIERVEAACAPVRAALEAVDDGGRPARKARKQLERPPIDDKLSAPIELPASPVVIDPSEVHSGAADVERLASAISGFVRRVNPGLEKLAAAVSPDEEALVVAVSGQAALLVTNRRLIVADAEGVQSINRADVLTVDRAGRLGGVKVEARGQGELAWSTLRPNNVDEDIRALLAEPVELAEPPGAEQPAELPPATQPPEAPAIQPPAAEDVIDQIRRLSELRDAGALTEAEFASKKEELLRRL